MHVLNFRYTETKEGNLRLLYWVETDRRLTAPTTVNFGESLLPPSIQKRAKSIHAEWITGGLWAVEIIVGPTYETLEFTSNVTKLMRRNNEWQ